MAAKTTAAEAFERVVRMIVQEERERLSKAIDNAQRGMVSTDQAFLALDSFRNAIWPEER